MVEPTTQLIAYCFIGIVGVVGNLIVLLSIFKVTVMPLVTKKLIANLAAIDLIINLVNIPWKIVNIMHPDLSDNAYWIALIRCKAMPYIAESLSAALINTLVILTVDRYIAIVHPFSKITDRQYTIIMILIWAFALTFSMPEMLLRHLNGMKCDLTWPSGTLRLVYYGFDAFENCIIPVCVVLFCYVVIWRIIKQRRIPGEGIGSERIRQRMEKSNIKVTKMILAITLYFVLSGVPLYVAFFVYEANRDAGNKERNRTIHFWLDWLDWLALTHLFMNPFLYCLLSTHIRDSFKNFIKCGVGTVAKNENASSTTSGTTMTNSIKLASTADFELCK